MRNRSSFSRDPYWTTARYDSTDQSGKPVKKGARIFYYPGTKTVLQGEEAEQAAREFAAAKADESMGGGW